MFIKEEPRKQPPSGLHWYSVETCFIREGTFYVMAKNTKQAKQLVKEKCGEYSTRIFSKLPLDKVGWSFSSLSVTNTGKVKKLDANIITNMFKEEPKSQPPSGLHWYSVETFCTRPGKFEVMAENEKQALQIVNEKCGQRQARIFTDLPLDQVAWNFPSRANMEMMSATKIEEL